MIKEGYEAYLYSLNTRSLEDEVAYLEDMDFLENEEENLDGEEW